MTITLHRPPQPIDEPGPLRPEDTDSGPEGPYPDPDEYADPDRESDPPGSPEQARGAGSRR
jgi:hypothetical protein